MRELIYSKELQNPFIFLLRRVLSFIIKYAIDEVISFILLIFVRISKQQVETEMIPV